MQDYLSSFFVLMSRFSLVLFRAHYRELFKIAIRWNRTIFPLFEAVYRDVVCTRVVKYLNCSFTKDTPSIRLKYPYMPDVIDLKYMRVSTWNGHTEENRLT